MIGFWTPENKDAKKRYNREFLISLAQKKLSQKFPEALTGLEIVITAENTVSIYLVTQQKSSPYSLTSYSKY